MSLALCSSWLSQAQDARHHGPAWTTGQLCGGSQVQLLDEFVVPVVCNDIWSSCSSLLEVPQGAAHHQGHLHPCRNAEFDPHGSDCSADH